VVTQNDNKENIIIEAGIFVGRFVVPEDIRHSEENILSQRIADIFR
jgi:hypothetical protein